MDSVFVDMDVGIAIGPKPSASTAPLTLAVPRHTHLIGASGCGMRALADVLAQSDWPLTGSDSSPQSIPGLRMYAGHAAEHLSPDVELVIYSDAVPSTNVELCRARALGIPTLSYFDMLGQLSAERATTAIAGTHGKSTVTAMTAHVLTHAGRDPTVFFGATPLGAASGGRAGRNALMLVEACEYRANLLKLHPLHAAILGIEPDHFDYYKTPDQLEEAFRQFAESVPAEGLLLVRHDCPVARRVAQGLSCRVESFGPAAGFEGDRPIFAERKIGTGPDWTARVLDERQGRFDFEIGRFGEPFCTVRLKPPGRHNMLNALAAAALAWQNGATAAEIAAGLSSFAGLHRRLEVLPDWHAVSIVDDYAHHPTEVAAALEAVRQMYPDRRVWAVFQPHQASRTARLLNELAASLQNADKVLVAEIFRAREGVPQPGEVTAADLAEAARRLGVEAPPVHRADEIVELLETHLAPGDVLVTLGAGDVARLRPSRTKLVGQSADVWSK